MSTKKTVERLPLPSHRPQKYNNPDEVRALIEAYFERCDTNKAYKVSKKGNRYEYDAPIPYTLEGICGALGMVRSGMFVMEKREKFLSVFVWARERVSQNRIEGGLMNRQNPMLARFLLSKNDKEHYDEKQQVELSGNLGISGLLDELNGTANKLPGGAGSEKS